MAIYDLRMGRKGRRVAPGEQEERRMENGDLKAEGDALQGLA
jgi:hypothetical protein